MIPTQYIVTSVAINNSTCWFSHKNNSSQIIIISHISLTLYHEAVQHIINCTHELSVVYMHEEMELIHINHVHSYFIVFWN